MRKCSSIYFEWVCLQTATWLKYTQKGIALLPECKSYCNLSCIKLMISKWFWPQYFVFCDYLKKIKVVDSPYNGVMNLS